MEGKTLNEHIESGQRSQEWFLKRHKRWTASTNKALMSEGKLLPQKDGGNKELKYKWGAGAKTALFNMLEARVTDTYETESVQSAAMERGEELEPFAVERFLELYLQYEGKDSAEIVSTGFILNPDDDGTREWEKGYKGENGRGGASPDHLLFITISKFEVKDSDTIWVKTTELGKIIKLVSGLEIKCRNKAQTNSHAYVAFDENHPDWWQVQSQMLSCGCDYWYYVHYDDRIEKPYDIVAQKVERSQTHIDKLIQRQKDADELIQDLIDNVVGDLSGLLPHERTERLIEAHKMIDDNKEVW